MLDGMHWKGRAPDPHSDYHLRETLYPPLTAAVTGCPEEPGRTFLLIESPLQ